MTTVPKLRLPEQSYWKHTYAVVIMSHTKAGYPIIRALLDMGMSVVAVAPQFKQNEVLRHLLTAQQKRRYFTKQVDLHRLISINALVQELKVEANPVKLILCLIPQIDDKEMKEIFERINANMLQTILEIDDMGVAALFVQASKHVIKKNFSHMWSIRFHHRDPELVFNYVEYLLTLADKAPPYLNVNLIRNHQAGTNCQCQGKES